MSDPNQPASARHPAKPHGQLRMTRIPVPDWAPPHARGGVTFEAADPKFCDAITPAEEGDLRGRREELLARVAVLVEEYADRGCAPAGEDWFPEQAALTGEYYIGGVSYHRLPGEGWIQVCVEARCLGRAAGGVGDYLGLHVWLRYDPDGGRLWNHRNTDSMVI